MFSSDLGVTPNNAVYVEDVFSTYLYTGNGSTQTITNGINLSTNGGLVWIKPRGAGANRLVDTARGAGNQVITSAINGQSTSSTGITGFTTSGFSLGADTNYNTGSATYASWTFRKQSKFFDIVTYTGTGANRTISHNLGSVPGCIMIKRTDTSGDWQIYHRSLGNTFYMVLNTTAVAARGPDLWASTTPTSTVFSLGTNVAVNANTGTYVAYLFAHDSGGFGLTGSDNVISIGSYTGTASPGLNVTLGYEPQLVIIKGATNTFDWYMMDNMRGMDNYDTYFVAPNNTAAESSFGSTALVPTATGFRIDSSGAGLNASTATYIYIAIRRGPMKIPTSGTSVYSPVTANPSGASITISTGFVTDLTFPRERSAAFTGQWFWFDRLRGRYGYLTSDTANGETLAGSTSGILFDNNTGFTDAWMGPSQGINSSVLWNSFRRAAGFFDVVCYSGTGSTTTVSHNLTVAPELMIFKNRTTTTNWAVYTSAQGATRALYLNDTSGGVLNSAFFNNTAPTASVFTVGSSTLTNDGTSTHVAYLFASCPGVSKIGSYTGNGSSQTIDCGFAAGARFILIKRTGSAGDWYVWDTARGIIAANDPRMALNSTTAEVTTDDSVDTASSGFVVNQLSATNINVNAATYFYLAIA